MYRLRVIHQGQHTPTEIVSLTAASDVLDAIPALLGRHRDCLRIEVFAGTTKLFAVDCEGQRVDA